MFFRAWTQYEAHGVLPSSGGWGDQPASYCRALEIAQTERSKLQAELGPDGGKRSVFQKRTSSGPESYQAVDLREVIARKRAEQENAGR